MSLKYLWAGESMKLMKKLEARYMGVISYV